MITNEKAHEIINYYAEKAGIPTDNFRVFFMKNKTANASCARAYARYIEGIYRPELSLIRFEFSQRYLEVATMEQFHNTVAHEFGHALTDPRLSSHGPEWRRNAIAMGADGKRCGVLSDEQREQIRKWKGICPGCGATMYRNRLTTSLREKACGRCCKGVYNAKFRFEWTQLR